MVNLTTQKYNKKSLKTNNKNSKSPVRSSYIIIFQEILYQKVVLLKTRTDLAKKIHKKHLICQELASICYLLLRIFLPLTEIIFLGGGGWRLGTRTCIHAVLSFSYYFLIS